VFDDWPLLNVIAAPLAVVLAGLPSTATAPVDIILRPNPAAAAETLDVPRVWNHELVIPNVRVTRRVRRPPGMPR
jgi:hypothetical protein